MNVRQLEAFRAVFTTGSVSMAAGRLGVTQPAVSTLISKLENDIGFPLFERIRGRLIATPEAGNLYGDHMISRRLESIFEDAGLVRNSRIEVYLFSTCCNFVHEGAGVALVDAISADHYRDHNIAIRPFEPAINFDIAILFPANHPRSQLTSEFAQALKNGLQKYLVK